MDAMMGSLLEWLTVLAGTSIFGKELGQLAQAWHVGFANVTMKSVSSHLPIVSCRIHAGIYSIHTLLHSRSDFVSIFRQILGWQKGL
jgi:hypothetical protein